MNATGAIKVNLITGFLGVGKTTAIRHLLARHPSNERWAVIVNEFGEVGVDGALLADNDITVQEVAGGCLCCVSAPAFTTGLNRVIRRQRPDRILIEPSGLGHPAQVLNTLSGPLYRDVLTVHATICLMDARHLNSPRHREHPNFQDQIHLADLLIANKSDLYTDADLRAFEQFTVGLRPAKRKVAIVEHGMLDPRWLDLACSEERHAVFPEAHAFLVEQANDIHTATEAVHDWLLIEGQGDGYQRAGWMIHQTVPWSVSALADYIADIRVERKKGLFFTDQGWYAVNQNDWSKIAPPKDRHSRLELIDAVTIDVDGIDHQLKSLAAVAESSDSPVIRQTEHN